jgi:hypothetical protein
MGPPVREIACQQEEETIMRTVVSLLILAAFTAHPTSTRGDGLIYKLPADGTQVVYDLNIARHKSGEPGSERKVTGTLSIAAVGKKKVDGTDCRWIEFTMKMTYQGRERNVVYKLLIPESDLGKGKYPLSNVKQAWTKQRDSVRQISDASGRQAGPLPSFLPNPLKEAKKAKATLIETGAGKLSAKKLTARTEYEQGDANRTDKFTVAYELQLADKTPFGVAGGKMTIKEYRNRTTLDDVIVVTLKLKSIDKKAKSGIPDKN